MYYVYALICPINKLPFYIGKGKGNRFKQHLNKSEKWNKTKKSYINGLKVLGLTPDAKIIYHADDEQDAFEVEHYLLNWGMAGLTNQRRTLDRPGGRPGKVEVNPELIRKLYIQDRKTKDQVCQELNIGKATINRILDENDIIKLFTKKCKSTRLAK